MAHASSRAWFAQKRYGYGAGRPISWQGWLALVLLFTAVGTEIATLAGLVRVIAIGFSITIFGVVCWLKTENGWHWRRGDQS